MATTNGANGHTNGVNGHTNGVNGHANGVHLPALSTTAEDFLRHEYDYVIVGGGTAGLAIAARLTENADVTVGVLEAGGNKLGDIMVDCPAMFLQMFSNPEYDYNFKTVPQKGNHDQVHHIPRGKALGGSSAINYMMYVRGSLQDYDDWAILADDQSWGAETMNGYMRKHQTLEPIPDEVVDRATMPFVGEHHGTSGPVRTSFNESFLPIEGDFIKACDDATGMTKKPKDPWSGDHIGFYNTLGAVARTGPNKGKRSYAARGYFEANADRPNLHVLCDATVASIELDGDRATGVQFHFGGQKHTVKTKREVIVCCGAMQSPQILELSGIGDPEVLKAAGVECKIENKAIGANYQDHPLTLVCWEVEEGNPTLEIIYQPEVMAGAQKQMMEHQNGPLTHISSTQGFFPYKLFATEDEQANILKSIEESSDKVSPFQRKQYQRVIEHLKDDKSANLQMVLIPNRAGFEKGIEDQAYLFPPHQPGTPMAITAAMCLQYPLSRGTVHIKSSDPHELPTVDPGFLSHPADAAILAAGVKMADKTSKSKHLEGKIAKRILPAAHRDLQDTKQATEAVHDVVLSEYHPCGSVALGDALDNKLIVKGTRNIRVADASIFPNNVSGNIVSSVYAVAEKAADLIKADWDYAALSKKAT